MRGFDDGTEVSGRGWGCIEGDSLVGEILYEIERASVYPTARTHDNGPLSVLFVYQETRRMVLVR